MIFNSNVHPSPKSQQPCECEQAKAGGGETGKGRQQHDVYVQLEDRTWIGSEAERGQK